jgi:hypothetical protein
VGNAAGHAAAAATSTVSCTEQFHSKTRYYLYMFKPQAQYSVVHMYAACRHRETTKTAAAADVTRIDHHIATIGLKPQLLLLMRCTSLGSPCASHSIESNIRAICGIRITYTAFFGTPLCLKMPHQSAQRHICMAPFRCCMPRRCCAARPSGQALQRQGLQAYNNSSTLSNTLACRGYCNFVCDTKHRCAYPQTDQNYSSTISGTPATNTHNNHVAPAAHNLAGRKFHI